MRKTLTVILENIIDKNLNIDSLEFKETIYKILTEINNITKERYRYVDVLFNGMCIIHFDKDGCNINSNYQYLSEFIKSHPKYNNIINNFKIV